MDLYLRKILKISTTLIAIVMFFYIMIAAKQFFYPIALAILLSYLLYPAVSFFEYKLKIGRFFSILIAILIGLSIVYFVGNLILLQIKIFIKDFPSIKKQALDNLGFLQSFIESKLNISIADQEEMIKDQLSNFLDFSNRFFSGIFKTATGTLAKLIFIPIFTFFMLFYRDRGKNFLLKIANQKKNKFTESVLNQISKVTIRYMTGVLTVVSILAISHSIALSIIGVKYAIFLGIAAASMSIIPYFGTLASTLVPLTFSLILTNNPYEPIWIIAYYLFINSIENNILTPLITGGNVHLNPLITILGLIGGAMVWGIPGMIIVIPLLGVIKIICDNVEGLEPYGYILGIDKKKNKLGKITEKISKKSEKIKIDKKNKK